MGYGALLLTSTQEPSVIATADIGFVLTIAALLAVPPLIGLTARNQHRAPQLYTIALLLALSFCAIYVFSALLGLTQGIVALGMLVVFFNSMFLYLFAMIKNRGANTLRMYVPVVSYLVPFVLLMVFAAQ